MDPEHLRAFAARDWSALAAAKRAHTAQLFRQSGAAPLLRAARALFERARAVNPAWPSAGERSADLAHHVHLKSLLDQVARVRRR
jgi:hypothetical protein